MVLESILSQEVDFPQNVGREGFRPNRDTCSNTSYHPDISIVLSVCH